MAVLIRIYAVVLLLVTVGGCAGASSTLMPVAAGPNNIPLLPDVKVVSPDATVPKELAAFSGTWYGTWALVTNPGVPLTEAILVVERVTPQGATVVHSMRALGNTNLSNARPVRLDAKFVDGALTYLSPHTGKPMIYRLQSDGTLAASVPEVGTQSTLKRQP